MKKIILFLVFCASSAFVSGQVAGSLDSSAKKTAGPVKKHRAPFALVGLSSGIGNPSGVLGVDFEFPVKKYIVIGTGLGFSWWGNKSHLDCKYFVKRKQLGWALTAGLFFNSGVYNFRGRMHTMNNVREDVTINMDAVGGAYLGASYYMRFAKGPNRFFVTGGWSMPFTEPIYHMDYNGPALADKSKRGMDLRKPGGPMLGIGFLFGLHH